MINYYIERIEKGDDVKIISNIFNTNSSKYIYPNQKSKIKYIVKISNTLIKYFKFEYKNSKDNRYKLIIENLNDYKINFKNGE